jgi:hypothetical protein
VSSDQAQASSWESGRQDEAGVKAGRGQQGLGGHAVAALKAGSSTSSAPPCCPSWSPWTCCPSNSWGAWPGRAGLGGLCPAQALSHACAGLVATEVARLSQQDASWSAASEPISGCMWTPLYSKAGSALSRAALARAAAPVPPGSHASASPWHGAVPVCRCGRWQWRPWPARAGGTAPHSLRQRRTASGGTAALCLCLGPQALPGVSLPGARLLPLCPRCSHPCTPQQWGAVPLLRPQHA